MLTSPTTPPRVTPADLARLGFSAAQIARLEALAQGYPVLEFLNSKSEWQHLVFLKWCYATRRMHAG